MQHETNPLEALLATEFQHATDETRAQLQGLEVADSDFESWLKAGGKDRRRQDRADALFPEGLPKFL